MPNPVQLWDIHEPISISEPHPPFLDGVVVSIAHERPVLPQDVEDRVRDNWARFKARRPTAEDRQAAYLVSYDRTPDVVTARVFTAGFSYNQWLNRDDREMRDTPVANAAGYNPFASWILPVSNDGYLLLDNKRDFGDRKVSGFGGFTNEDDLRGADIHLPGFIHRKLREELGVSIRQRAIGKALIGLVYYPRVGPKGFDGIYVVTLDGKADTIAREFDGNSQFSRQLIPVRISPTTIVEFLEGSTWQPTTACVAGLFTFIGSDYGREELQRALSTYSGRDLVRVFDSPVHGSVRDRITT